ncbi:hypothetical protein GW17_00048109 [Ensete ventricosum]|nr:hypothetical protein GW17_00048109 [Ensete ventricosum]
MSHWGARATAPTQPTMGYEYQQRGTYPPPQTAQYPQPYGGYSQQTTPRGSYGGKDWDQRSSAPAHNTPTGGYDYYGQGGPSTGTQSSLPNTMSGPSPGPVNYGRPQTPNYGQPTPYGHPAQQHYGQGYNEPSRYDSQGPGQQFYGQQQTVGSQPGVQSGFSQQQSYGKPPYGVPHQEVPPYGGVPPRSSQPGDPTYQGHASSAYGSGTGTTSQQYPYGPNIPSQPAPSYNQTYGPTPGAVDGYTQPPSAASYAQQGGQAAPPGYGQVAQPVPAYTHPSSQPAGYGQQYASSHQGYGGDAVPSNGGYGYPADAAYGNTIPGSGYGAPPAGSGQPGYAQQPSNPSGYYDQSVAPR